MHIVLYIVTYFREIYVGVILFQINIYIYIYIPGTTFVLCFASKTRSFPIKTRDIWVPGARTQMTIFWKIWPIDMLLPWRVFFWESNIFLPKGGRGYFPEIWVEMIQFDYSHIFADWVAKKATKFRHSFVCFFKEDKGNSGEWTPIQPWELDCPAVGFWSFPSTLPLKTSNAVA